MDKKALREKPALRKAATKNRLNRRAEKADLGRAAGARGALENRPSRRTESGVTGLGLPWTCCLQECPW